MLINYLIDAKLSKWRTLVRSVIVCERVLATARVLACGFPNETFHYSFGREKFRILNF